MSSDNESEAGDGVLERGGHFVPRSDDDEVLWSVLEITAERGNKYKVKWDGLDPSTGKPWAQSWVAKHDCTDDLVADWKAKKKRRVERKRRGRGRAGTASRTSGTSGRTESSTPAKKTRNSTSEATTSRLNSIQEQDSPPPNGITMKRKRAPDVPATTANSTGQEDESSRPRKKLKTALEMRLCPPVSDEDEDEDEDALLGDVRPDGKGSLQEKAPLKRPGPLLDSSGEEDSSPPKDNGKGRSVPSKDTSARARGSDLKEAPTPRDSENTKTKTVPRREGRVYPNAEQAISSSDDEPRQHKPKKKSASRPRLKSPPKRDNELSETDVAPVAAPVKVGPPRGIRHSKGSKESEQHGRSGLSPANHLSREADSAERAVPTEVPIGSPVDEVSALVEPSASQEGVNNNPAPTSPPLRISIPPPIPTPRPASPNLSPGARARLELFDRMMVEPASARALEPVLEGVQFDCNDTHESFGVFDPPRPLTPPPSKLKSKPSKVIIPNELIVPETESSGNSQSQSQPLPPRPPSPQPPPAHKSPDRPAGQPTIAVVSTTSSPSDLFPLPPKVVPSPYHSPKRPSARPVQRISPNTFRTALKGHLGVIDSEVPPSSIESFTSPNRIDKGKQKAVEEDLVESSPPETGDDEHQKGPAPKKITITDSVLKKKGKELFDRAQLTREAKWQKIRKPKRLKPVNDIIDRATSSLRKASPLPLASGAESNLEMRWEEVIDLTGGANDATLDTTEPSGAKKLTEEDRERLRIELRQEEEESTQEAINANLLPPINGVNNDNAQMPPPKSSEHSPSHRQGREGDIVEQPSASLQLASVIVQPSQEQRHEDTDMDSLPVNQLPSSPAPPIFERLTNSPERKLGEALSLLNLKSEEIQRLERELADYREKIQCLEAELAKTKQSSEPTQPVLAAWEAERAQWTQERSKWESDRTMWEVQCKEWANERADLLARIAELPGAVAGTEEDRVKLSELGTERTAWIKERDALLIAMTRQSEELAALAETRGVEEQTRVEQWEAERASWVEERTGWETERATLQEKHETASHSVDELNAAVASLTSAKVSIEKDRDFFREQYVQASGFVNSVRDENVELEERARIAEGQAREGVVAIKALYEGRIKALQGDINRFKGLAELLQEKDRQTNDELRLRAAQTPELIDLCGRLTAENKSLVAEVRKLGVAQQRGVVQRNKLYYEIIILKKERASLKSKLSKFVKKAAESSTQETSQLALALTSPPLVPVDLAIPDPSDTDMDALPEPTQPSPDASLDEPELFPCMWRPDWRDQCQHVFDAKEDLERHLQDHLRALTNI